MEREDKGRISDGLAAAGLGKAGGRLREAIRVALREAGADSKTAVRVSWECVEVFVRALGPKFQVLNRPAPVIVIDQGQQQLLGQQDDAQQLRDAYRWVQDHFATVVQDSPAGTVVDYGGIPTPPSSYAFALLETWAAKPMRSRDGLHREIRSVLAVSKVEPEIQAPQPVTEPEPVQIPVEYAG